VRKLLRQLEERGLLNSTLVVVSGDHGEAFGQGQGQSLFDSRRLGRVYLFGPYSGLFGYREGTRKLIHDPIANEDELYDLASDPQETLNIAFRHPEAVQEGRERLAAWVQQLDSGALVPPSQWPACFPGAPLCHDYPTARALPVRLPGAECTIQCTIDPDRPRGITGHHGFSPL
jgi:arylsulfatase A-like enzyme